MLPLSFIQQTRPLLGDEWEAFEQALQLENVREIVWVKNNIFQHQL